MTLTLQALTELEAVNIMLESIGEMAVNTLDDDAISDASVARQILHNVSRQIQAQGLQCNSEKDYSLIKDENGNIYIPNNALQVDASDTNLNVSVRGNRLYDKDNHTFAFKDNIDVDIVLFLPWEELPEVVRDYVVIKAARQFQRKVLGSETLDAISGIDEAQAFLAFRQQELKTKDCNIFKNPSYTAILRR
jgi:hypothetical protein